jgi:nitrate/TMAO reductase-like tetraheme cytochrome c subunit
VPDFYGGDECLFCHRFTVGQHWQKDPHFRTVRGKFKDARIAPEIEWLKSQERVGKVADEVEFVMGGKRAARFLRRNDDGRFEILDFGMLDPASNNPSRLPLLKSFPGPAAPVWKADQFSNDCIGCHMTGVDAKTLTPFESFVGCETCHGPHNPEHTNASVFLPFARKAKTPAEAIASTCGSCHLRGGQSRSTGRPFPNNFVAGDNLFKDYIFDFSKEAGNPIDGHIARNIRDIVIYGKPDVTCVSCHKMHPSDTAKHRRLPKTDFCHTCHQIEPLKDRKKYEIHSGTCQY